MQRLSEALTCYNESVFSLKARSCVDGLPGLRERTLFPALGHWQKEQSGHRLAFAYVPFSKVLTYWSLLGAISLHFICVGWQRARWKIYNCVLVVLMYIPVTYSTWQAKVVFIFSHLYDLSCIMHCMNSFYCSGSLRSCCSRSGLNDWIQYDSTAEKCDGKR